jgi:hypothetical protein
MKNLNLKIFVICYLFFIIVMPAGVSASAVKSVSNSGLVGYWPLNDGAGSKANDMSGSGNNGTLIHSPTWENGKLGKALLLNNSNSYVSVPSVQALKYVGGNMTLETWIYPNIGETAANIISKPWNSSGDYNYRMTYGPAVSVILSGATSCTVSSGANTAPQGSWHHVVFTIATGGAMNLYIDGALVGSGTCGIIDWTPTYGDLNLPLSIGTLYPYGAVAWDQPTHAFGGKMDNVRFYSRVLSATEIKTIYQFGSAQNKVVSNSGLVGYWPLNDSAGSKANDMSGKGNIGTISGTASWVNGKFNKALSFDGSTNYIQAGPVPSLTKNGTYTFSAWLKAPAVGTQTIFQSAPSCADRTGAVLSGSGVSFGYYNGTAWVGASGSFPANQYFHFAGVNNGGILSLYINGVLQSGTSVPYVHCLDGNFYLGENTLIGDTSKFAGMMDDVRVYSRVLSVTEIQQLYKQNATQINSSKNDFLTNGLVGLWSFDGKDMNWGANKVLDRSGQGNDGTLYGMSTTSSPTNGKLGQALKFRGVSSGTYVNLGTSATLTPVNFAVSAWVNAGSGTYTGGYGYVYSNARDCCTAGQNGINVFFTSGILYAVIWNGGSAASVNSPVAVAQNSGWHHIVATYNGATLAVYVDGVLKNSASTALGVGTPATYTTNIGSMGYAPGVYTFDGKIDDVRLYNRAITATEVKQLYNLAR